MAKPTIMTCMTINIKMNNRFNLLIVLISVLLLGSCASKTSSVLRYEVKGDAKIWPQEPEIPRYKYIGELTGENNI